MISLIQFKWRPFGQKRKPLDKEKEAKMATIVDQQELTHDQFRRAVEEGAVAFLPVGATEQHGFMPLGLDFMTCIYMMQRIVAVLLTTKQAPPYIIKMPGVSYGASDHHICYSGTVSIGAPLFMQLLDKILREIHRSGIRLICIVNGHGGNENPIAWAVKSVAAYYPDIQIHHHTLHYLVGPEDWRKMHPAQKIPESVHLSAQLSEMLGEHELSHADAFEAAMLGVYRKDLLEACQRSMEESKITPVPDMTMISGIRRPEDWFQMMMPGNGGKGDPRKAVPEAVAAANLIMQKAAEQVAGDLTQMWKAIKNPNVSIPKNQKPVL